MMHAEREKSNALGVILPNSAQAYSAHKENYRRSKEFKERGEMWREMPSRERHERQTGPIVYSNVSVMLLTFSDEGEMIDLAEMRKRIHAQQALEYWEAKLSEKKINLGHDICYERIPDTRASLLPERHSQKTRFKLKRGLPGFVNGARVSALPDTGCSGNIVSLAFAQEMKLAIHGPPTNFRLGNSTSIKSLGRLTLSACSDIHTVLMLPQVP